MAAVMELEMSHEMVNWGFTPEIRKDKVYEEHSQPSVETEADGSTVQNTKRAYSGHSLQVPTSRHRLSNASSGSTRRPSLLSRRLSSFTAQKHQQCLSEEQQLELAQFSSISYQPTHSSVYTDWLRGLKEHSCDWDRWLLLLISGVLIGLTAVLLKQSMQFLDKLKWTTAKQYAEEGDLTRTWLVVWGTASLYILISSIMVVFVHPPATGSGVPEVISYLNGVVVHGVFSLKNLVVKFVSLVFAVSSGLLTGTQGPVIAMDAIIGSGVGQFKSKAIGFHPKWFARFRNPEDRRAFTTAGVAAGVAAAFNAPIGGLLFAMEDLTSFWSKSLCWQTFFCSGVAALVASLLNAAFTAYEYQGEFGLLPITITEPLQMHILIILPALLLGLVGGLLGALFTRLNTWIVGMRKKLLATIKNQTLKGCVRCVETLVLVVLMSLFAVYVPALLSCTEGQHHPNETLHLEKCGWTSGVDRETYNCGHSNDSEDHFYYNEAATLVQGSGSVMLNKLVSRGTHRWFGYLSLGAILPVWFFGTIYIAGTALTGGIFLPVLTTGALYGRMLGLALVDLYHSVNEDYQWDIPVGDQTWAWLDPGVMAVIGAGSLLGGVTRLTLAVTVIVVEMSNAIDLTVPVLVAIWVAKIVADLLSKPLYKYQLDGKSLPYLDSDPVIPVNGQVMNLDLFKTYHVMSSPVLMIKSTESVYLLSNILLQTSHSGFPVVKYDQETRSELAVGLITRLELSILLCTDDVYQEEQAGTVLCPAVAFEEISVDYVTDQSLALERIRMYNKFPLYRDIFLNVEPFINRSVPKVDRDFSLKRTYQQFHTMGMRHMLVTDKKNRVEGMITRKDLIPFNLTSRLERAVEGDLGEGDKDRDSCEELPSITKHVWMTRSSITEESEVPPRHVLRVCHHLDAVVQRRGIIPQHSNCYPS